MQTKNVHILLCCLMLASSFMHGVVAQYTKQDKKKFEDLVDVSFTKSALATKARKDKRIEDLRLLSALMIRRLVNLLDGSGLRNEFKTADLLKIVAPAVIETTEKPDLFAANRFAVYDFEKKVEDSLEAIFQAKRQTLKNQPLKEPYIELKATLAVYETKLKPFTLLTFDNKTSQEVINKNLKKDYRDSVLQLKRVLRPTKEETIKAFKEALPLLDKNYKKIVSAITTITKSPTDVLPESLTYFLLPS